MKKLEEYVRSIPDFPEPGIIFRDVTTILQDADGLHLAVDSIRNMLKDVDYDVVVGPESRGFIFVCRLPMQSTRLCSGPQKRKTALRDCFCKVCTGIWHCRD